MRKEPVGAKAHCITKVALVVTKLSANRHWILGLCVLKKG
jgi:hypothetical protein